MKRLTAQQLKRRWMSAGLAAGMWVAATGSWAQGRPIEMVVGLAPGGAGDVSARMVARHLEKPLGRSIVVINKPGSGQVIAAGYLAKSPPAELTIGYMTNAIITSEMSNLAKGAYRTHDLEPVCQINASGSVLVIRSDLPVRTYAEFEEYARKNTLTAGHQGNGSANHFRLTMLSRYRNIPFTMVPYRGEADVINTLMGRHVDVAAVSPTTALRHLGSGQIRVLMSWDELHAQKYGQPIPLLKDIDPRIPDVGVKTYLWTRKTAPQEQIAALRSACAQVARDPAFEKEFTGAGFDLVYRSSEQVAEDLKRDIAHYQTILKEIGPTE